MSKQLKSPEDKVVKESVYLTGAESKILKDKHGNLTDALKQMLFDMKVQEEVEKILADPALKKARKDVVKDLVEKNAAIIPVPIIKDPKKESTFLRQRRKTKLKIE